MDFFMETDVLVTSQRLAHTSQCLQYAITDNYTSDICVCIYIYVYGATIHIDLN